MNHITAYLCSQACTLLAQIISREPSTRPVSNAAEVHCPLLISMGMARTPRPRAKLEAIEWYYTLIIISAPYYRLMQLITSLVLSSLTFILLSLGARDMSCAHTIEGYLCVSDNLSQVRDRTYITIKLESYSCYLPLNNGYSFVQRENQRRRRPCVIRGKSSHLPRTT